MRHMLFIFCGLQVLLGHAQTEVPELVYNSAGSDTGSVDAIYNPANRKFSGIPSIEKDNLNRLWSTWYAGKTAGEDHNNYVVLAYSDDDGLNWTEHLYIDPDKDGQIRAFDSQLWNDPNGALWLFWSQSIYKQNGETSQLWSIKIDTDDGVYRLGKPFILQRGVMTGKPVVLSTGEWVLPISVDSQRHSAQMVVSLDEGRSWHLRGGAFVPAASKSSDEHMIVERLDGSLWMLVRTIYGIGEAFSTDNGYTWTNVRPSAIRHTESRFFIGRLASNALLLIKHGGISEEPVLQPRFRGRSHLTAFLSYDDGVSWSNGLLLDYRDGVSYPDCIQDQEGNIFITYDFNRMKEQLVYCLPISEQQLMDATPLSVCDLDDRRLVISQGGIKR